MPGAHYGKKTKGGKRGPMKKGTYNRRTKKGRTKNGTNYKVM